jgi:hypothetical protein
MLFDSLILLAAAVQPLPAGCDQSLRRAAAVHAASVSPACLRVRAIVDLEKAPENVALPAIFRREGGGKAIVASAGPGPIV